MTNPKWWEVPISVYRTISDGLMVEEKIDPLEWVETVERLNADVCTISDFVNERADQLEVLAQENKTHKRKIDELTRTVEQLVQQREEDQDTIQRLLENTNKRARVPTTIDPSITKQLEKNERKFVRNGYQIVQVRVKKSDKFLQLQVQIREPGKPVTPGRGFKTFAKVLLDHDKDQLTQILRARYMD